MKGKIFSFFLCFILIFNLFSFSVYAESVSPSEWSPQWLQDIRNGNFVATRTTLGVIYNDCVNKPLAGFSTTISTYDSVSTVIGAGMSYFVKLVKDGLSPEQALQQMNTYITVNGDGNYVITGDGNSFLESYYNNTNGVQNGTGSSLDDLGYVNYYIPSYQQVNPTWYSTAVAYRFVYNTIKNNPEWFFTIWGSDYGYDDYYYYEIVGSKIPPLGGVCARSYWGNTTLTASMYNDNWTQNFQQNSDGEWCVLAIQVAQGTQDVRARYCDGLNGWGSWSYQLVEDATTNGIDCDDYLLSELPEGYRDEGQGGSRRGSFSSYKLYSSPEEIVKAYANNTIGETCFHGSSITAIPIFDNLLSLKKGTQGLATSSALLPTYNGQTIAGPVTAEQVQQADSIINNYYNKDPWGGGSPSDPGGGGSSDDSGSGNLWSVLASAVKNLINFIVEVLGSAIGALTELLDKLVGFFSNARELVGSGFADFVAAFFPYLPEEWITLVSLSIGLVLFFWVLKKFT